MKEVLLQPPLCKSIAARVLILQALNDKTLMRCPKHCPADIKILKKALIRLKSHKHCKIYLQNNGTAMRFLTAYCAALPNLEVVLCGDTRLQQRPIADLVIALQTIGADITYLEKEGQLPLLIRGKNLNKDQKLHLSNPSSTQYISALLLIGVNISTDIQSPYIDMTHWVISQFQQGLSPIEKDWSSAAFWYEYVALHDVSLFLQGLKKNTVQGDRILPDIFASLGVQTIYYKNGIKIQKSNTVPSGMSLNINFSQNPDIFPSVAISCWKLKVRLQAGCTERLVFKESNRLAAISDIINNKSEKKYHSFADHRIAMALLCADMECDDTNCINKSYPLFLQQLDQIKRL